MSDIGKKAGVASAVGSIMPKDDFDAQYKQHMYAQEMAELQRRMQAATALHPAQAYPNPPERKQSATTDFKVTRIRNGFLVIWRDRTTYCATSEEVSQTVVAILVEAKLEQL